MERSGTHWLTNILNNHPDIAAFPTLYFYPDRVGNKNDEIQTFIFNHIANILDDGTKEIKFDRPLVLMTSFYNGLFKDIIVDSQFLPENKLVSLLLRRYEEFCDTMSREKGIVGESCPGYIFHLDLIDSFYENTKKLCVLRDEKDRIVSWYFSLVEKGMEKRGINKISREFALSYVRNRIIPEYEALLAYKGEIFCLSYEQLKNKPHDIIKNAVLHLGKFAGNELIDTMISTAAFHLQTDKDGRELGRSQLRKGKVGEGADYIDEQLRDEIEREIRPLKTKILAKFFHE